MAGLADMDALDAAAAAPDPVTAAPVSGYRYVAPWTAPDGSTTTVAPEQYAAFKAGQTPPAVAPAQPPAAQPGSDGGGSALARMDALDATAAPTAKDGRHYDSEITITPTKRTGAVANLMAGANEAAAGTVGLPVDVLTGAMNLIPRGINAAAGTSLPLIENPVGGSEWWKSAMGLIKADPRDVAPDGMGQAMLRGVGSGAVGALMPMGAAGQAARALDAVGAAAPVARSVAATMAAPSTVGTAITGAAGGMTGQVAQQVVPDSLKPLADIAGNIVGGGTAALGGALANAGLRGAVAAGKSALSPIAVDSPFVPAGMRPQTTTAPDGSTVTASPWQAAAAQRALAAQSGATPQALAASIPAPADYTLIPGSVPTLGQATGNQGVLSTERALRTQSPQAFNNADAARNTARVAAGATVGGPAEHAEAAGNYVTRTLNGIDAAGDAHIAAERAKADAHLAANGAHGQAADYGQAIREAVDDRRAPVDAHLAKTEREARTRLGQADAAMGGEVAPGALQRHGETIRSAVSEALKRSKAEVSRLFEAIDPEGKLTLASGGMRAAGRAVRAELIPGSGDKFSARVEHLVSTLESMPPVVSFKSLQKTRQVIGEAMREQGVSPSEMRHLSMLRNGVDQAVAEAVAGRAHVEAPHVEAGHLGPDDTALGRLAREAMERYAARNATAPAEVRAAARLGAGPSDAAHPVGNRAGNESGLPSGHGSEGGAGEGRADRAGGAVLQGDASEPTATVSAADADAYQRARSAKVDQVAQFQGAPSEVTARGKDGAEFRVPVEAVARRFWNKGTKAGEDAQSLVRALGSREAALSHIADAAAFDLRTAPGVVQPDGTFNTQKFQNWLAAHREALNAFPELRQRFGTVLHAQQEVDAVTAQRAAVDAAHPISSGTTNADVTAKYWRPGRNGAEAVQSFGQDVGTSTEHTALLSDTATNSLQAAAMKNGVFDRAAYDRWMTAHEPAMSAAPPELRARFEDFGKAQSTVEAAQAAKAQQLKAFQDSAARVYLTRAGEVADPQVAMGRLMASDNPGQDAAQLMRIVGNDAAAKAGVQRNLADWIFAKARSTATAGTTQEKQIAKAALDRIMNDPKSSRAIEAVFNPEQVATLRGLVADMDREAMSMNATKIPGSPGTASDLHAIGHGEGSHGASVAIGAELMGEALSHAAGVGGLPGIALKGGSVGAALVFRQMRAAGMKQIVDLQTAGALNPEIGRMLLSRPAAAARPAVLTKLAGLLGDLAVSGARRR